jgi:hypothetical protein
VEEGSAAHAEVADQSVGYGAARQGEPGENAPVDAGTEAPANPGAVESPGSPAWPAADADRRNTQVAEPTESAGPARQAGEDGPADVTDTADSVGIDEKAAGGGPAGSAGHAGEPGEREPADAASAEDSRGPEMAPATSDMQATDATAAESREKQIEEHTEARNIALSEQIGRGDTTLPGGSSATETPGEMEQGSRSALSGEEQALLGQRRDDLAANNPGDYGNFSKDPDHFSKKTGYKVTDGAQEEAKTALDLCDQGKLPLDIQRPAGRGEGDFYSPQNKQYYDIKEVNDTPPHEFNPSSMEESIKRQLVIGRTPIIDTRGGSQQAIDQVADIVKRNGWNSRVIWYP